MAESEPGGEVARSELRASHEDRDRVVELLRVSAGDGRLTAAGTSSPGRSTGTSGSG